MQQQVQIASPSGDEYQPAQQVSLLMQKKRKQHSPVRYLCKACTKTIRTIRSFLLCLCTSERVDSAGAEICFSAGQDERTCLRFRRCSFASCRISASSSKSRAAEISFSTGVEASVSDCIALSGCSIDLWMLGTICRPNSQTCSRRLSRADFLRSCQPD